MEKIILAAGCFWCSEAVFQRVEGVDKVTSGYANGDGKTPTYERVCSETSGYAEAVELLFDETKISLQKILAIFFQTHDPTSLNHQGNDFGTRYRSAIYYVSEEQKHVIEEAIATAQEKLEEPIVTEVQPLQNFYVAEDYHQDYYNQNRMSNPYCLFVIDPKIKKLERL